MKEQRKYWTEEEVKLIFRAAEREPNPWLRARNRALMLCLYWRGLRASEIGRLKFSHWREKAGRLYIERLKGSLTSEPLLSPAEQNALKAWKRARGAAPGPLFNSREGIGGVDRRTVFVIVKKLATDAGLPVDLRHPHCAKHSIGTHLAGKLPLPKLQQWLGHRDPRSTLVYAQFRSLELDSAAVEIYADAD